jgi:hypothetical protein
MTHNSKKPIEKRESIFDTEKRLKCEAVLISKNHNTQFEKIKYLLKN